MQFISEYEEHLSIESCNISGFTGFFKSLPAQEDGSGDGHAVDRGNAPMEKIGDKRSCDDAGDGEPIDGPDLSRVVNVGFPVEEIAQDKDDAHRGKGAVQDIEPSAEIPVKPNGRHCPEKA